MLNRLKSTKADLAKVEYFERIGCTWDQPSHSFQLCTIDLRDSLRITFSEIRDTTLAELKRKYPG
jgi:hypothetical protein